MNLGSTRHIPYDQKAVNEENIIPSTEADLIDKRGVLRSRNEGENRKGREEKEEKREENRAGLEDL